MTCTNIKIRDVVEELQRKSMQKPETGLTPHKPAITKPKPTGVKPNQSFTPNKLSPAHKPKTLVSPSNERPANSLENRNKETPNAETNDKENCNGTETDNGAEVPTNVKNARAMFENSEVQLAMTNRQTVCPPSKPVATPAGSQPKHVDQTTTVLTVPPKANTVSSASPSRSIKGHVKPCPPVPHASDQDAVAANDTLGGRNKSTAVEGDATVQDKSISKSTTVEKNIDARDGGTTSQTRAATEPPSSEKSDPVLPEEQAAGIKVGQVVTYGNKRFKKLRVPRNFDTPPRKPGKPPAYDLSKYQTTPSTEGPRTVSMISEYTEEDEIPDYEEPNDISANDNGAGDDDIYDDVQETYGDDDEDEIYEELD